MFKLTGTVQQCHTIDSSLQDKVILFDDMNEAYEIHLDTDNCSIFLSEWKFWLTIIKKVAKTGEGLVN